MLCHVFIQPHYDDDASVSGSGGDVGDVIRICHIYMDKRPPSTSERLIPYLQQQNTPKLEWGANICDRQLLASRFKLHR